jgi:rRNA processing protein Gar1
MSSHGKSQNMKTKGIVIRKKKQLVICINLTVYVKNTEYVGALYINM